MSNIGVSYKDLCQIALELINQLTLLKDIINNDAINIQQLGNKEIYLLLENHRFHLERTLSSNLKKINEIMALSVKYF